MRVADVVAALDREEALSEALPDELADAATAGKSLPRRLGKALSRRAETRFPNGLVLARAGRGHGDVTLCSAAVTDTDKDHVPFVSLDVLQILHEERLVGMASKVVLA